MPDPSIVVTGTGDFSGLNRALGQADGRIDSSRSRWSKLGSVVKGSALGAAAGVTALAAASIKLAQGAAEDERGQVRLATALRNNTGARASDVKATEDWISAQGRAFGVTDDDLRPAIARLSAATKDQAEAQKLARLGEEVAAEGTFSLTQVTKALAKARNGSTAGLAKFGIKVKESTKDTAALKSAQLAASTAQDKYTAAVKKSGAGSKEARDASARLEIAQIKLGEAQQKTKTQTIDFDEAVKRLSRTYRGQASKAAETTAGKYARLKLTLDELGESIGARLLPLGNRLADGLLHKVVPAVDGLYAAFEKGGLDGFAGELENLTGIDVAPYLEDMRRAGDGLLRIVKVLGPAFVDAAQSLPAFVQPLELLADGLGVVANVLEALPDGLLSFGIQAGIAALVLPRLAAGTAAAGTAMAVATTRVIGFSQALTRANLAGAARGVGALGTAARSAAGIGGLLALSQASQQADEKTKLLGTTAGGALLGFSLGGPIGAAIGAGAGALFGLATNTNKAKDAMDAAGPAVDTYRDSLDDLTAATTRTTRAQIYKTLIESGTVSSARQLGVANRDVVNAVLGQESALARVTAQLAKTDDFTLRYTNSNGRLVSQSFATKGELDGLTRQLLLQGYAYKDLEVSKSNASKTQLLDFIGQETREWKTSAQAKREEIVATQDLSALRGKIPRSVVTKLETTGIVPSLEGVARVVRQYKLVDGKKIKALIAVSGAETSVGQVRRFNATLRTTGQTKANTRPYLASLQATMNDGRRTVSSGAASILSVLSGGVANARAYGASGAAGIGSEVKYGFPAGFAGADGLWSASLSGAVRAAIHAGRDAARVESPSKETAYIGEMMGRGVPVGIAKTLPAVRRAGKTLAEVAVAGVVNGSQGIGSALEKITHLIEKGVKLKDPKKEAARERAILKGLRDEYAALRTNGRLQDQNNTRLNAARDRYRGLVQDARAYAGSVKDSFVSFGSVIGLGQMEDGSVSTKGLLDQLQARLATAQRFAALIRSFRDGTGPKLNQTTIQQLIDAGPEAAIATAEAIAAGGADAVTQINSLTSQIGAAGGKLGQTLVDQFKQAGITAAAGVVAGLEARRDKLDRIAIRLADKLVDRVEAQIGTTKAPTRPAARLAVSDTYARSSTGTAPAELKITREAWTQLEQGRTVHARGTGWTAAGGRTLA